MALELKLVKTAISMRRFSISKKFQSMLFDARIFDSELILIQISTTPSPNYKQLEFGRGARCLKFWASELLISCFIFTFFGNFLARLSKKLYESVSSILLAINQSRNDWK